MDQMYTTGIWRPVEGAEVAFIRAWSEFAAWASTVPGAGKLRLTRDAQDPGRFVSFGAWDNAEHVHAWRSSPEFRHKLLQVRQHVAEFESTDLELVVTAESGTSTAATPVAG